MELEKKPVGTFVKKQDFLEPRKVKITGYAEKPDNFKEGRTNNILSFSDKENNNMQLQINNARVNDLINWFGPDTDEWEGNLIEISATNEGEREITEKDVNGVEVKKVVTVHNLFFKKA